MLVQWGKAHGILDNGLLHYQLLRKIYYFSWLWLNSILFIGKTFSAVLLMIFCPVFVNGEKLMIVVMGFAKILTIDVDVCFNVRNKGRLELNLTMVVVLINALV